MLVAIGSRLQLRELGRPPRRGSRPDRLPVPPGQFTRRSMESPLARDHKIERWDPTSPLVLAEVAVRGKANGPGEFGQSHAHGQTPISDLNTQAPRLTLGITASRIRDAGRGGMRLTACLLHIDPRVLDAAR